MSQADGCELCVATGASALWRDAWCRVVLVDDADYPGYCRVVWHAHVREMTDLSGDDRRHLMDVVYAVERALRDTLQPDKINLASFGNLTPHLHWHVIPRFSSDAHFPNSIWGERLREPPRAEVSDLAAALHAALVSLLPDTVP